MTTRQRELAVRRGAAVRARATVAPFAAAADGSPAALADLVALLRPGEAMLLVEPSLPVLPPALAVTGMRATLQMVAHDVPPAKPDPRIRVLGEADAAEMRALAALTEPGPFRAGTHRLGRFVGIHDGGRLVAMAGERLRPPGHTEASAVCTHPDARGRGLARLLLGDVMHAIAARGEIPFLHCYADNAGAIAVYESLGFRRRTMLQAIGVVRPG